MAEAAVLQPCGRRCSTDLATGNPLGTCCHRPVRLCDRCGAMVETFPRRLPAAVCIEILGRQLLPARLHGIAPESLRETFHRELQSAAAWSSASSARQDDVLKGPFLLSELRLLTSHQPPPLSLTASLAPYSANFLLMSISVLCRQSTGSSRPTPLQLSSLFKSRSPASGTTGLKLETGLPGRCISAPCCTAQSQWFSSMLAAVTWPTTTCGPCQVT